MSKEQPSIENKGAVVPTGEHAKFNIDNPDVLGKLAQIVGCNVSEMDKANFDYAKKDPSNSGFLVGGLDFSVYDGEVVLHGRSGDHGNKELIDPIILERAKKAGLRIVGLAPVMSDGIPKE